MGESFAFFTFFNTTFTTELLPYKDNNLEFTISVSVAASSDKMTFKYFHKLKQPNSVNVLPDENGPLCQDILSSSIREANLEVSELLTTKPRENESCI